MDKINDLPLLKYLMRFPHSPLVFFTGSTLPQLACDLPHSKLVISNTSSNVDKDIPCLHAGWNNAAYWNNKPSSLPASLCEAIAVVMGPAGSLPINAWGVLISHGFSRVIFSQHNLFYVVNLRASFLLRLQLVWWHTKGLLNKYHLHICTIIRKAILKVCAKDLHDFGIGAYEKDEGFAFKAALPIFEENTDSVGKRSSRLLLFEESVQLVPHQPHLLIRRVGSGLFSHWESDIYFSSTDNTNPNSNGRRYRVLNLRGITRCAAIPLWLTQRLDQADPTNIDSMVATERHDERQALRERKVTDHGFSRTLRQIIKSDSASPGTLRGFHHYGTPCGIVLFIGSLTSGGSERQLCNLARALKQLGHPVRVYCQTGTEPSDLHYYPMLTDFGIPVDFVSKPNEEFDFSLLVNEWGLKDLEILQTMPGFFDREVWNVYTHLMIHKPSALHCWLDGPNIIGAIAALIAGVPRILLNVRSVNPTNFSYVYQPWFKEWYQLLLRSPRVVFGGNSRAGISSYCDWLGYPSKKCVYLPNGIDFEGFHIPSREESERVRLELGISPDAPVVAGIFRFSPEKRPLMFIEVFEGILQRVPDAHAIVTGIGPLYQEVSSLVHERNLADRIHLLGARHDIPAILQASNILLLTSEQEGLPNVLIEAQFLSRPVVSTLVGGTGEAFIHGKTGLGRHPDDLNGLVDDCCSLLLDPKKRQMFGGAGHEFVCNQFSLAKLAQRCLDLYALPNEAVQRDLAIPEQMVAYGNGWVARASGPQ